MDYKVISVQEAKEAIKYLPKAAAIEILRQVRNKECYSIVNRGEAWYKRLTESQKAELDEWYEAWMDVTDTLIIPEKPYWIDNTWRW